MPASGSDSVITGSLRRSIAGALSRIRLGAIQWLILCAAGLVIAIMLGTGYFALQFRERALEVAERELNNTALLLSRHFDQQLSDLQHVHDDVVSYMQAGWVDTADEFEKKMSTLSAHEMLRTKLAALPHVGGLNLFNAKGRLINSSEMWPVPDVSVSDRRYFQEFTSGKPTPDVIVEPVVSKVTKVWTTIFARKIVGRNGEIIGFASRGVEPTHFEDFVASLALNSDTAISMIHRDGTIIARYPRDEKLVGQNVANSPSFQRALALNGNISGRFTSSSQSEDKVGAVRSLMHFPILIVATTKTSTALADWRAQTKLQFYAAALAIVVVVVMIFLIVRQLRRQHDAAQRKLSEKSQHLDTAINNMTQGLLLFDASGRLVICNQRYIDMFGVSPGCRQTRLPSARPHPASPADRLVRRRRRRLLREVPQSRRRRGAGHRYCDAGRAHDPADLQALAGWRLGHDAGRRDRGAGASRPDRTSRPLRRPDQSAEPDAVPAACGGVLLESESVQFAILYIDIDEFKRINDSLGHLIGDEFLKGVADRLRQSVGPEDFIARLGGDEFAIVQRNVACDDDVSVLVARIYEALRTPFDCNGHRLASDASIGVAVAPRDGIDLYGLLKSADLAMYAAKAAGRRTYRFFEPTMETQANLRRELESDLRMALVEGGFEIHYQPLVDLRSDDVTGCEALLRWRHPLRGMVSPADFIPVAEDTGLIEEIGQWVLRTACAEAATWPAACARRRQRLADPVQVANAVVEGCSGTRRDRARPAPAGTGNHRGGADRR